MRKASMASAEGIEEGVCNIIARARGLRGCGDEAFAALAGLAVGNRVWGTRSSGA
jgi:hypothetical protein